MKEARNVGGSGSRTLVTGGTGFIGSRLVAALARGGSLVRMLVRDRSRLAPIEGIEPFEGDLTDAASLRGIEAGVDRVVHCAANLGKWGAPPAEVEDINVGGTQRLIERFGERPPALFLHLSAGGVTGPCREKQVDESYVCRPATVYERSKLRAEQEVLERGARLGIPAAVVRPTYTYGPGDPHKLPLFRAVERGRFLFIGDGRSVNHPAYIDDVVAGVLLALDRARAGEVYIIGGERPVSKRELIETIAEALEVEPPRMRIPRWFAWSAAVGLEAMARAFRFQPPLTRSRVMMMADNFGYSIAKARAELDYQPKVGLRDGIARTVRDYRERGWL